MPVPEELLCLGRADLEGLGLQPSDWIDAAEEAVRLQGAGQACYSPAPGLHPHAATPEAFFHAMTACVGQEGAGVKWVAYFPQNLARGLPHSTGLLILNEPGTGLPVCVMDGMWVTYARTAAVNALAARHLARPDAETLTLIGVGGLGRASLLTFREVLPRLREVRAYARHDSHVRAFIEEMARCLELVITPAASVQAAVEAADVLVSSPTEFEAPFISPRWLKPGSLACPLAAGREMGREGLRGVDRLIVEDSQHFTARLERMPGHGPVPIAGELAEIVLGRKPGRERPDERIAVVTGGIGTTDIVLARRAYERALARHVGVWWRYR